MKPTLGAVLFHTRKDVWDILGRKNLNSLCYRRRVHIVETAKLMNGDGPPIGVEMKIVRCDGRCERYQMPRKIERAVKTFLRDGEPTKLRFFYRGGRRAHKVRRVTIN